MVGELCLPCGSTVQLNLFNDDCLLIEGTEKQTLAHPLVVKGTLKKQSFKSTTISAQSLGIIFGDGKPGCNGPISSITSFIFLRS